MLLACCLGQHTVVVTPPLAVPLRQGVPATSNAAKLECSVHCLHVGMGQQLWWRGGGSGPQYKPHLHQLVLHSLASYHLGDAGCSSCHGTAVSMQNQDVRRWQMT